jgi:hypothetical protein
MISMSLAYIRRVHRAIDDMRLQAAMLDQFLFRSRVRSITDVKRGREPGIVGQSLMHSFTTELR